MKLINLILLVFLISCSSNSQHVCEKDSVLDSFLNTDISYSIDKDNVDLTSVFEYNQVTYLGFIGESKKKIDFYITYIERDPRNPLRYFVEGKTKIYSEKSKFFKGDFLLDKQYEFSEKLDEDISYTDEILKQGFSVLNYELKEDNKLQNTGVYKGKVLVSWYVDTLNKTNYDDTLDYYSSYSNCQFFGSWTNYETEKEVLTAWGQYRIPCSGDLDIGASEFSPNPKYYSQGWESYRLDVESYQENLKYTIEKYKIAIINDSDGYTNLRKEPNSKSEVVSKIIDKEYFFYAPVEGVEWSNVKTLKKEEGYVHNSRIKDIQNDELISVSIFDHDMESTKDTIINISSFTDSATFLINDFNYKKIEGKHLNDSLIIFLDNKSKIKISKGLFKAKNSKIEYEDDFISLINGEKPWGVENNIPKYYVSNIAINNKVISKNETQNLFQPNLDYIKVFKKEEKYIVWMLNGNGAGAYNVVFIIEKNNVLKRFIYLPF
ncbi:hypothetical protein A8C32_03720 [Flavivirga aquatica]|uniref:SH3b domain-containing protein n=1 Tax=Flavivirga aquatica TaxID=1849968 RepID=A0A1E5TB27_9FLAO|nr:SH3 domain-containing protein [Flavivirga aquatica]OEK08569.1 hypothetical protein A8C32_03720 [Flavivirga aquatica]